MTLSRYLIVMTFSAILGWVAWILVLFYIDPFTSGLSGFILFYISLIFALIGTLSVIGYFVRARFHKEELTYEQVANAFRQAILLSVLVTISLFLRSQGLLKWWNIILLIIGLTLLEVFIMSRKAKKSYPESSQSQDSIGESSNNELPN